MAGNYNQWAQLSTVIVKANTNADNATTRAVMFHLGKYMPHGVPDTFGFNGVDASQTTGDTVALTYPSGIGLGSVMKFRWNGNGVELIGNTGRLSEPTRERSRIQQERLSELTAERVAECRSRVFSQQNASAGRRRRADR